MNCSDLEYFSKHSVCLRQNFQGITQNYQCKPRAIKLESGFVFSWSQMLATGDLCFTKLSVDFWHFWET